MTNQTESPQEHPANWDPFPVPSTIPAGWDLSEYLSAPAELFGSILSQWLHGGTKRDVSGQ